MTKAELVDQVAAAVQVPKNQTEVVITQFLQALMEALQAG
jgi:nucleoid DNA-binding protein